MTDEQILQHLSDSGVSAEKVGEVFFVSDANCFVSSVFEFFTTFQTFLYIMTAFLLAGWGWSLIRGAKMNIVVNLRNLFMLFVALSLVRPIMIAFYGTESEMRAVACRPAQVAAEDVRRAVALSAELELPDGFMESMMTATELPEISAAVEPTESAPFALDGADRRLRINRPLRTGRRNADGSPRVYRFTEIENVLSENQLNAARQFLGGMRVRERDGGGSGRFGSNRGTGGRDHLGTDFVLDGGVGDAMPALFSGRITSIGRVYARSNALTAITIENDNGTRSRVLYVRPAPGLRAGMHVNAGDIIGYQQDVHTYYRDRRISQHIHYEMYNSGQLVRVEGLFIGGNQ